MTERRIVCVSCPLGCEVAAFMEGGSVTRVEGHGCSRGERYARQEALEPMRILTTSVRVTGGTEPLAAVRTSVPVAKRLFPAIMDALRQLSVAAPVHLGQVVARDVLGTHADLVVTRAVGALRR